MSEDDIDIGIRLPPITTRRIIISENAQKIQQELEQLQARVEDLEWLRAKEEQTAINVVNNLKARIDELENLLCHVVYTCNGEDNCERCKEARECVNKME